MFSTMLDLRSELLSGLTSVKFHKIEKQLANAIDFGNRLHKLDMVIRNDRQRVVLSKEISIIELFRNSSAKYEEWLTVKNAYLDDSSKKRWSDDEKRTEIIRILCGEKDTKVEQKSLYLQMKNNLCKVGDEAEFICSLNQTDSNKGEFRQISDNLLLRWDTMKIRNNIDYIQSLRGLFVDIANEEFDQRLVLVIKGIFLQ